MAQPNLDGKPKAALIGLIGVALLVGSGATFALWNDEARLDPELIGLGQLSVSAGELDWFDISKTTSVEAENWIEPSQVDGTSIDINSFRMVPGDLLWAYGQIESNLVGETLTADLDFTGIYDENGESIQPNGFDVLLQFIDPEGIPVAFIEQEPGSPSVAVRMLLGFPTETDDSGRPIFNRNNMNDLINLSDLQVRLTQTRPLEDLE